jgi:hypothetical protein
MIINASSNFRQEPLSRWEHSTAFDTAAECENAITYQWQKLEKENRQFIHGQRRCVPADSVYPHTQPKK